MRVLFTGQEFLVLTENQRNATDFIGISQCVIFNKTSHNLNEEKQLSNLLSLFFAAAQKSDGGLVEATISKLFKVDNRNTRAFVKPVYLKFTTKAPFTTFF